MDFASRLQIEHACARLIKIYCNSIDAGDVERLLGVFAEDAVWQRPGNPPLKGHAEIRHFVEHHGMGTVSAHHVTNIVVDVADEDSASSNAYALSFREKGTPADTPLHLTSPRLAVHYMHKFVRDKGRWYIKRKDVRWLFQGQAI